MSDSSILIQQGSRISHQFNPQDFDLGYWQDVAESECLTGGRNASRKIMIDDRAMVLRLYRRGGIMAHLLYDRYLWTGLHRARPWKEKKVIQHAIEHDLPVAPVLAFYLRRGLLFYRAAIISQYISNRGTLAECLVGAELDERDWKTLGTLIRKMHFSGICHADLNANNILIDQAGRFYLIDFDKAGIKTRQGDWCRNNLERLLRSLNKIQGLKRESGQNFHFTPDNWQALLNGYGI